MSMFTFHTLFFVWACCLLTVAGVLVDGGFEDRTEDGWLTFTSIPGLYSVCGEETPECSPQNGVGACYLHATSVDTIIYAQQTVVVAANETLLSWSMLIDATEFVDSKVYVRMDGKILKEYTIYQNGTAFDDDGNSVPVGSYFDDAVSTLLYCTDSYHSVRLEGRFGPVTTGYLNVFFDDVSFVMTELYAEPSLCTTNLDADADPAVYPLGDSVSFEIYLRDQFNRPLVDTHADLEAWAISHHDDVGAEHNPIEVEHHPSEEGTFVATFIGEEENSYDVSITVDTVGISGSIFKDAFIFETPQTNPNSTVLLGYDLRSELSAGDISPVLLTTFDQFGEPRISGGDDIVIDIYLYATEEEAMANSVSVMVNHTSALYPDADSSRRSGADDIATVLERRQHTTPDAMHPQRRQWEDDGPLATCTGDPELGQCDAEVVIIDQRTGVYVATVVVYRVGYIVMDLWINGEHVVDFPAYSSTHVVSAETVASHSYATLPTLADSHNEMPWVRLKPTESMNLIMQGRDRFQNHVTHGGEADKFRLQVVRFYASEIEEIRHKLDADEVDNAIVSRGGITYTDAHPVDPMDSNGTYSLMVYDVDQGLHLAVPIFSGEPMADDAFVLVSERLLFNCESTKEAYPSEIEENDLHSEGWVLSGSHEEWVLSELQCDGHLECTTRQDEGSQCAPSVLAISYAVYVIYSVEMLVLLLVFLLTVVFRNEKVLRAASPLFSLFTLVGIAGACTSTVVDGLHPQTGTCMAVEWLFFLSYNVILAAIIVKADRIAKIFGDLDTTQVTNRRQAVPDTVLLRNAVVLLMPTITLLIGWTATDPMKPMEEESEDDPDVLHVYCGSKHMLSFRSCTLFYLCVLLSVAMRLAYRTRKVHKFSDRFKEARSIGVVTAAMFALMIGRAVDLLLITEHPIFSVNFRWWSVLFVNAVTLYALFYTKMAYILLGIYEGRFRIGEIKAMQLTVDLVGDKRGDSFMKFMNRSGSACSESTDIPGMSSSRASSQSRPTSTTTAVGTSTTGLRVATTGSMSNLSRPPPSSPRNRTNTEAGPRLSGRKTEDDSAAKRKTVSVSYSSRRNKSKAHLNIARPGADKAELALEPAVAEETEMTPLSDSKVTSSSVSSQPGEGEGEGEGEVAASGGSSVSVGTDSAIEAGCSAPSGGDGESVPGREE